MLEGYSKNLYGLLRKYTKLPRPNEIWRSVPNRWTFKLAYFYANMALSESMSHAQKPMSIFNTIVGLLILFELKQIAPAWILVIVGIALFLGLLIVGHTLIAIGFLKQQAELKVNNEPDLLEIRNNVRKLMWKSLTPEERSSKSGLCKKGECPNPALEIYGFCEEHLKNS